MTADRPMSHRRYTRWAINRRNREARDAAGITTNWHGLYTFCCAVTIITLAAIGFGLIWMVNR